MAFSLYASTDDATTQLNDGLPFRFESVSGLSSSPVSRYEQRGPTQSGATDLGYRLNPRAVELNLVFTATDDATLDGYRDTLMSAFTPLGDISTSLTVLRDDGEIRTLTCHREGEISITFTPELRPGHTHRATFRLRAASPLWQANAVTSGTATFTGMESWWLAGGAISSGSTSLRTEYPAQGYTMLFNVAYSDDWAVAFVTEQDTGLSGTPAAFADAGSATFHKIISGTAIYYRTYSNGTNESVWPGTTGFNLHVVESRSGTQFWRYWDGTALSTHLEEAIDINFSGIPNGPFSYFRWRGGYYGDWTPHIRKGVWLHNVSTAQLTTLAPYMLDTLQGSITLVNDGDVNAYPVIDLRGPIADPIVENITTGRTIDLTGGTIADGVTWTIDLRTGNKRIYDQDGNSVLGSVTTLPIALADFALPPAPIATGGTNIIVMTPGSVGSAAVFQAQITNQYLSF